MCVEQRATWGQWTRQKPLLTRVRPQSIFGYVSLLSSQQGLRMVLPLLLAFPPLQRNKSSTAADDKLLKVEHGGLVKGSFHKTGKREQNRWWLGEERRCKEEVWGAETAQCQVSRRQAFHGRMAETWPSMFKGRWATNIPTEVWRLAKYQTIQYHNVVLIWHWLDSLGVEKEGIRSSVLFDPVTDWVFYGCCLRKITLDCSGQGHSIWCFGSCAFDFCWQKKKKE